MRQLRAVLIRFANLFRRTCHEQGLAEEIESNLQFHIEDNIRAGMTPAEARRAARLKFGSIDAAKEACRDRRGMPLLETLVQDAVYAVRLLMQSPRFTIVALMTIVLTVGAISTVFTLVNSILLEPLPYPDSGRLVHITQSEGRRPGDRRLNYADFLDLQRESRSFEALSAYTNLLYTLEEPDKEPYSVLLWSATPEVFPILGIRTILGRGLRPEDRRPENTPAAVVSYDFWQQQLGAREDVIGTTLRLPRHTLAFEGIIVGVVAPEFLPPLPGRSSSEVSMPGVWTDIRVYGSDSDRRGGGDLDVIGRLRREVPLDAARAELETISKRLAAAYPDTNRDRALAGTFVLDRIAGSVKAILWILFGAVSFVLLIGLTNLINLQIVRNAAREREIYIRAALGAGRGRLIRQLLVESVIWSTTGGALALLAAWAAIQALRGFLPARFPRADNIQLDATVFLFALGVSVLAGVLVGVIPALRVSKRDLQGMMNEGSHAASLSPRRGRIQKTLIAAETALALVLLVGAALLANSFFRLFTADSGMNERDLWGVTVSLPSTYRTPAQRNDFWTSALHSVRELPQVESAAITASRTPLSGSDTTWGSIVPDGAGRDPRTQGLSFSHREVGPDYFRTIGVPIIEGRPILDTDTGTPERVVVLNETAGRLLWPGESPVGKRMRFGNLSTYIVIGVIPDFKHNRLNVEISPQMYTSYLQDDAILSLDTAATIMVRLKPEARDFAAAITSLVANLEGRANIRVASMTEVRWNLVVAERFQTGLLLFFALSATFLAMVGIFGVVSYSVAQRRQEIGLRMALGAARGNVIRLMVRQAMLPAGIGLLAGLAAAWGLTRLLSAFLFEVQATDPTTFVSALLCLAVAAFLASLIPARRAARIDPMVALRHD
jgi:putative ABC transport system permease protein